MTEIIKALVAADDERPRSKSGFGISGLGGCERKAWHQMRQDEPCNPDVKRLPAILGTAIHGALEKAADRLPGALAEVPVYVEEIDLAGTADVVRDGTLDDYKTTSLKNLRWIKSHGPSRNHRFQVMTYAYAIGGVHTVRIIYIPRDGDESDVLVWEAPYDEATAREAIEWAAAVRRAVDENIVPAPEKHHSYCANWCQFWGNLCPGLSAADELEETDDPWLESAARWYLAAVEGAQELEDTKASAREALEGFTGIVGEFQVTWQRHRYGYYPRVTRRGEGDVH